MTAKKPHIRTDDAEIRRLAALGRTYRQIGEALGRSDANIRSYCWNRGIEVKRAHRKKVNGFLEYLAGLARNHRRPPTNAGMARHMGVSMGAIAKRMQGLIKQGVVQIEYEGGNSRRRIHVQGIGWTDWSLKTEPGQGQRQPQPAVEAAPKPSPEEVFAGVWFDEVAVPRDPRRFPRPATRVLTGVTGAWA